jgi:hypothetical protein
MMYEGIINMTVNFTREELSCLKLETFRSSKLSVSFSDKRNNHSVNPILCYLLQF